MDLKQVLDTLDYPDRYSRSSHLYIRTFDAPCQWVFRPTLRTVHHTVSETASVAGSDSDVDSLVTDSSTEGEHEDNSEVVNGSITPIHEISDSPGRSSPDARYEIEEWLQSTDSVLCICGKPGTGKSNLIVYLKHDHRTMESLRSWQPDVSILSHCFWNGYNPLFSNKEGLYRDLTFQILERRKINGLSLPDLITQDPSKPSVSELERILFKLLEDQTTCIFIDSVSFQMLPTVLKLASIPNCKVCFSTDRIRGSTMRIEQQSYVYRIDGIRRALWTPLRDSGLDPSACMDIIITVANQSGGVYLIQELMQKEIISQLENKETIRTTIPRSLADLRTSWLSNSSMPTAAQYYSLALNYEKLMRYSSDHFINHFLRDGLGYDISVLEITLCLRPELKQQVNSSELTAETIKLFTKAMKEVCIELLNDCGNVFELYYRWDDMDVQYFLSSLDSCASEWDLRQNLDAKVRLLPAAASFLEEHGRDILGTDQKSNDDCWLEITTTYLFLVEMRMTYKNHVNRALVPLDKIGSPHLLEKCQELYRNGLLRIVKGYGDCQSNPLPPFLALAALPNSREVILDRVGDRANDILRHLVERVRYDERGEDVLDLYYDSLAKVGDPFEKGIIGIEVRVQPEAPRALVVSYESAATRIIKLMIEWSHLTNERWVKTFSPSTAALQQRTSIAIDISLLEDTYKPISVNYGHHWDRYPSHRTGQTEVTNIAYVLEVDLELLYGVVRRRLGGEEPTGHAKLRSVSLRKRDSSQSFEVLDVERESQIVPELIRCMCDQNGGRLLAVKTLRDITEDDGTRFKPVSSLVECLLASQAGYVLLENKAFQKACTKLMQ